MLEETAEWIEQSLVDMVVISREGTDVHCIITMLFEPLVRIRLCDIEDNKMVAGPSILS
jgi:2-hydroxy-3-keto-5-methylthiopentenyl-1-phosphate phosphatase